MLDYRDEWVELETAQLMSQFMNMSEDELATLPDMTGCVPPSNGLIYTPEEMYKESAKFGVDDPKLLNLFTKKGWLRTVAFENDDLEPVELEGW